MDLVIVLNIFVAVLGASNYTFVTATQTQKTGDWLLGHRKAFEYFGGVVQVIVPDNPKSLIANPDRYEPQVGRSYAEFAAHYGCAVIPARPRKPQDKGKVEVGVQVVERWILAKLRHQQFFSLADLNIAIAHLLEDLNTRPFKKLPGNRRSAFEAIDRSALKPLPTKPFEMCSWKKARVGIDYHVELEHHYYSVPHQYVRKHVELRYTTSMVEVELWGKLTDDDFDVVAGKRVHFLGKIQERYGIAKEDAEKMVDNWTSSTTDT